ncbi:hypothetical protein GCM10025772_10930 [Ferrimonas gelatinilytica]|uniref:Uncharacterized protein n=1 Tax=Ferrimonas gelatinilytica TaxID=1255257 RepID=A0ABP9RYH6_9GAMM
MEDRHPLPAGQVNDTFIRQELAEKTFNAAGRWLAGGAKVNQKDSVTWLRHIH